MCVYKQELSETHAHFPENYYQDRLRSSGYYIWIFCLESSGHTGINPSPHFFAELKTHKILIQRYNNVYQKKGNPKQKYELPK